MTRSAGSPKTTSTGVEEFLTDEAGEDGGTVFYNRLDPSAAVLKLTPGISAEMVHDMGIHLRALIVEGFGMGGIPDYGNGELSEVFRNLSSCGVRVIMTTQVFQGGLRLVRCTRSGRAAQEAGLIAAEGMTTEYAVMRAMWALAYSYDADNFRGLFLDQRN